MWLTSYMILNKMLQLPEPQLPPLLNGGNSTNLVEDYIMVMVYPYCPAIPSSLAFVILFLVLLLKYFY